MYKEAQIYWTIGKLILGALAVAFFLAATIRAQSQSGGPSPADGCGSYWEKVINR
jgi:hypothetical protein